LVVSPWGTKKKLALQRTKSQSKGQARETCAMQGMLGEWGKILGKEGEKLTNKVVAER
jgi:hypothetical protein